MGTALLFLIGQGFVVVLVPWRITHWQAAGPYPFAVRAIGVALVVVGGIVVVDAFVRFATEGIGTPLPFEPTSRDLIVGGPYRYLRNPMYLASVATVTGQALLLSRAEVLIYAASLLATAVAFVHWIEEPALAKRFGARYEDYRERVPGWWPRLPRRTPPG